MEADETESHSVITEGNSLYPALTYPRYSNSFSRSSQNHPIARFSSPVNPPGEALNDFSRVALDDSDEFYRMQPGKNTRNFSSYPQISNVEGSSRFMGNIPLSSALMNTYQAERFSSIDDQEKLASLGTFECLFGYTETRVADNSSDVASSSFGTMLPGYEGLSFDTGGRLDFSKILSPQELVGNGGMEVPSVEPTGTYVPNEWAIIEQGGLNSSSPGSSRFSNEVSLSLATSQPSGLLDQSSEMSSSGVTSYSFHNSQIVSERGSCSTSKNVSLSSSSYRPLQPATLFLGSRFMQAMQEILAEIGGYALENVEDGVKVSFSRLPDDSSKGLEEEEDDNVSLFQERDEEAKKKHLLTLLQLVDDRYNQCLDEIHTVTSAFHAVTELDPNLHARFALATISFMYKNLKERISSHILAVGAHHNEGETSEDKSFETSFLQKQWALQQLSKRDHHFWRPQRGLPERSVSILRAWMFQNFLHPYPKDAEKHLLAVQSGLTRNQVSNWFINARVRLWKPMIEEMCAEMNKQKPRRNSKETEGNYRNINCFDTRRFTMD